MPSGFIPQWVCYFQNIGNINWPEAALSFFCLLTIIIWNRYVTRKVPGALIALLLGTAIAIILNSSAGMEFATIGSKFPSLAGGMALPSPVMPDFSYDTIRELFSPAFTIAMLCAIESLLAAMVADGVTGKQHHSNTELIAQAGDIERLDIHKGVEIYEINGPYFFGLAAREEDMLSKHPTRTYCRIIRMRKVPFIDSTGVKNLRHLCDMARQRGLQVVLSGVQPEVMSTLEKFGLDKELGREHIFDNIVPALAYANDLADKAGKSE